MRTFASALKNQPKQAYTNNGMKTLESSGSSLVDLFFAIGSSRGKDISAMFERAYQEDAQLATKMLFYVRDARGGAGERKTFRDLLQYMEQRHLESLMKNIHLIPEYGRWDDLLVFNNVAAKRTAFSVVRNALAAGNGLCAKWMPRKGPIANELRQYLDLTPKAYRKLLVRLTNVVEQQMCAKDWSTINYDHVPSVAAARYQKAFNKHDKDRYTSWKSALVKGERGAKVNASTLYPYDVFKSLQHGDATVAEAQWKALPNFLGNDYILPMIDTSGSMGSQVPGQTGVGLMNRDVAYSIGLYIADKQQGPFNNMVLSFSGTSEIRVLEGSLTDKFNQIHSMPWGMNTSLESGFKAILNVATRNKLDPTEMPKYLLVLSDMEFDAAAFERRSVGAFDLARQSFHAAGYELPNIVWWNLNAREGNVPVKFNEQGCALVSGFSPAIVKNILKARNFSPDAIMRDTLMSDRYAPVTA